MKRCEGLTCRGRPYRNPAYKFFLLFDLCAVHYRRVMKGRRK